MHNEDTLKSDAQPDPWVAVRTWIAEKRTRRESSDANGLYYLEVSKETWEALRADPEFRLFRDASTEHSIHALGTRITVEGADIEASAMNIDPVRTAKLRELIPTDPTAWVSARRDFCVVLNPGPDGFRLTQRRLEQVAVLVGHTTFELCIGAPGDVATLQSYPANKLDPEWMKDVRRF